MIDITFSDEEKNAYAINAIELRLASFRYILILTAIVGWVWLSWASWPRSREYDLFYSDAWSISALLLVLVLVCYMLHWRHVYGAIVLFVLGLVGLLTGLLLLFRSPDSAYLYIIPLIFSSVLLGQLALLLVAMLVSAAMGISILVEPELSLVTLVPPFLTIVLAAIAVSITTRNLHIALAWTLNSYRHAHANELLARERKAQLGQAVTSLDRAMSRLQRVNTRLTQVSLEAEEARRLKQQFAQTISHELRTPLNLIAGFTETMIKSPEYYGGSLPPNYLRDLSVVYRNACHLQDLVNDVLDLARLETAYLSLQTEELDMGDLIRDAVGMARRLVEGRGLALYTDIAPDLPPVLGDGVRLRQVILNLLKNAARFTQEGSVTVRAWAEPDRVIVAVTDTGIGIPEDSLGHIFESFRQLENPMQRRTEGAGLGLAISQQLIALHGGAIWVESTVDVGSTFYFSLPVKHVTSLSLDQPLDAALSETANVSMPSEPLVLVVTRSPSAATLLTRHLAHYRVLSIGEQDQVHAAMAQLLPHAVIVDSATQNIDRAWIDGLATPSMPVITCALPGEERLRRQSAADGYLIKPITRQALWDMLRHIDANVTNVLVVDDDRDFVRLIGRMLMNPLRSYNVTYAYSGVEALHIIKHTPPDILLLDLRLPDIDGHEIIRVVRQDARFNRMRILVITAYEDSEGAHLLSGPLAVSKAGWRPNDVMQWLQATLDAL